MIRECSVVLSRSNPAFQGPRGTLSQVNATARLQIAKVLYSNAGRGTMLLSIGMDMQLRVSDYTWDLYRACQTNPLPKPRYARYLTGLNCMFPSKLPWNRVKLIILLYREAISKVISPSIKQRSQPGNHYYVFVDMESPEEANRAIKELNGSEFMGSNLRINRAKGDSHKPAERERWRAKHESDENENEN